MKVLLDLNVLLDVIQNRQPHFTDSAEILNAARAGELEAIIPFHAVTTIFYLIERARDAATANADFSASPVKAVSPADFLIVLSNQKKT